MAIELISKIKPKNGGKFPLVDGENIAVVAAVNESYDASGNDGNLLRSSFHLGNTISLDGYDACRINRVGIRAAAGTAVRFALYGVESGVLTQLTVLGDAVSDSETQVAVLTLADGYEVRNENIVILAFAREAALHCVQMGAGVTLTGSVQFDDADYFDNADGAQIPCYDSSAMESPVAASAFVRDIDFLTEQTLEDYLKGANGRFAQLESKTANVLPAVTVLDNGKFLRVVDGAWATASVDDAEGVSF